MADIVEKLLNTRIQLKYDSYNEWTSKNPTLRAGEVAIAYLASTDAMTPPEGSTQHPVLFKVGPGKFNDLPWASALAADVHSWAKKTEADFTSWVKGLIKVTDIDAYSKAEIDNKLSANSTADQKYAKDYADSLAGNYDAAGSAASALADAKAYTDDLAEYTQGIAQQLNQVSGNASAAIKKASENAAIITTLTNRIGSIPFDQGVTNVVDYIDKKTEGIATESAVTELGNRVTAIEDDYLKAADKTALEGQIAGVQTAVDNEKSRAEGIEAGLASRIKAVEDDYLKAADKTELQGNIDTLTGVVEALRDGVDADKVDGVIDLINYVEEHGADVTGMKEDIADNAAAIAALNAADGKVANAGLADVASSLNEAGIAQVKGIKVDNAGHADSADNASQLGGVAAENYATKAYADQAEADAIASANANTAEVIKNYYTKSEADAAFMDSTETGNAIDAKITALNLAATYEPIGAETRAKAYADGLAGNYATAAQGVKADSALQSVEVGSGLKVSAKANNKQTIEIDTDVVFVFNCGNASTLVD